MCGGSPPPIQYPKTPSPFEEAQAQAMLAREQEKIKAEEDARKLAQFNSNLEAAYTGATGRLQSEIGRRGLNTEEFSPLLTARLGDVKRSVPVNDPNPESYFGTDIVDQVIQAEQDRRRSQYNQQLNQFAAPGFADTAIPNTLDDPLVAQILSNQYSQSMDELQRAYDRGTLSDIGFSAGQGKLGEQRQAAGARLSDIGEGVLSGYRSNLTNIADLGRTRANAYTIGDVFDPNSIRSNIENYTTEARNRLSGDLYADVGSQNFFDVPSIIASSGRAQGVVNNTQAPNVLSAIEANKKKKATATGIGSQGTF